MKKIITVFLILSLNILHSQELNETKNHIESAKENIRTQNYEAAEISLTKALFEKPNDFDVLFLLGFIKFNAKNYDLAFEYFNRSVTISMDNEKSFNTAKSLWWRGFSSLSKGDKEKSCNDFMAAVLLGQFKDENGSEKSIFKDWQFVIVSDNCMD